MVFIKYLCINKLQTELLQLMKLYLYFYLYPFNKIYFILRYYFCQGLPCDLHKHSSSIKKKIQLN